MKKNILLILFFLIPLISHSQQEEYEEIKIKISIDKGPLAGANIYIENLEKNDSFTTDFEGEAIIKIPKDKDLIRLSFMGPTVRFKILRPTDYIVVDLDSKKVWYYFNGKKIKKKKIKFTK
ncbi:hypothetical protein [Flavobacterium sp. UBA6195]|uniref:hypothetical protein n=1 Tax=Flavobacterium sp. UBA6195 TaxID=1946554 RepID=UPI0025BE8B25|nr:hypothetical protein [Flavobacterium sp. UBA6195]